eukprot:m.4764 g.4764  ORF g.4764 m.4764 type:complete len:829 (-) comp7178_c0_seq1:27-2513(-)
MRTVFFSDRTRKRWNQECFQDRVLDAVCKILPLTMAAQQGRLPSISIPLKTIAEINERAEHDAEPAPLPGSMQKPSDVLKVLGRQLATARKKRIARRTAIERNALDAQGAPKHPEMTPAERQAFNVDDLAAEMAKAAEEARAMREIFKPKVKLAQTRKSIQLNGLSLANYRKRKAANSNITLIQGFDRVGVFHVKDHSNDDHNAEAVSGSVLGAVASSNCSAKAVEKICGKAFKHIPFVKVSDVRGFKQAVNVPACEMLAVTIDSKGVPVQIHQEEEDSSMSGEDDELSDSEHDDDETTVLASELNTGDTAAEMIPIEHTIADVENQLYVLFCTPEAAAQIMRSILEYGQLVLVRAQDGRVTFKNGLQQELITVKVLPSTADLCDSPVIVAGLATCSESQENLLRVNREVDQQLLDLVLQGFDFRGVKVPVSLIHNNDGKCISLLLGMPAHCQDNSCSHCVAVKSMYATGEVADPRALEDIDGSFKKWLHSAMLQLGKEQIDVGDILAIDVMHQMLNFSHYHINQLHRLIFSTVSSQDAVGKVVKILNQFFSMLYKRDAGFEIEANEQGEKVRDAALEKRTITAYVSKFEGKDGKDSKFTVGVSYPNVNTTIAVLAAADWEALPALLESARPKRTRTPGRPSTLKDSVRKLKDSVRHLSMVHTVIFRDEQIGEEALQILFSNAAQVMRLACPQAEKSWYCHFLHNHQAKIMQKFPLVRMQLQYLELLQLTQKQMVNISTTKGGFNRLLTLDIMKKEALKLFYNWIHGPSYQKPSLKKDKAIRYVPGCVCDLARVNLESGVLTSVLDIQHMHTLAQSHCSTCPHAPSVV